MSAPDGPWEPDLADCTSLARCLELAVYQAVGTASMCWENVDRAGVFDEDAARWVASGLVAYLRAHPSVALAALGDITGAAT